MILETPKLIASFLLFFLRFLSVYASCQGNIFVLKLEYHFNFVWKLEH